MHIDNEIVKEVLKDNKIEIDPLDSRSPAQYVTELLIYIAEIEEHTRAHKEELILRSKSAQSESPYFA